MAIFNPIAQKEAAERDPITYYGQPPQKKGKHIKGLGRQGDRVLDMCMYVCVLCERPKCGGGQPPIMSASKTRALMAAVCLQGGL